MTFNDAITLIRGVLIDTPFYEPPPSVSGSWHRTAELEPGFAIYSRRGSVCRSYRMFLDRHYKPAIWEWDTTHDIVKQCDAEEWLKTHPDADFQIFRWNIQAPPWEISEWIKANRGLS